MSEKALRQSEKMKEQTIGVEVEMNNITREKAAKIAAELFGTGRYEYTDSRNGYLTWSAWSSDGREWKFQRDTSILGVESKKCELVTPILKYEDIDYWREVFNESSKAEGKNKKEKTDSQIIKWLQNPHSDSAEYKLWGNGVALPCVYFVLSGIEYYAHIT